MAKNKTLIGHIKGPKGDPGEKGEPGEKGSPGTDGIRGSRWTTGNKIFGTNTAPAVYDTGIEDSLVNDQYLNKDTGDVYCCTKSGDSSTAEWVWTVNLKTDLVDAYTKAESDNKYAAKDDLVDAYTKTESDETFLKKTDSIDAYTKTESDKKFAVKDDLKNKADNIFYDEEKSELQLRSGDTVLSTVTIKSSSGGSSGIALAQPTTATVASKNQAADIKWTDPEDLTYAGATLATWQKTVVVRKKGSAPSSVNDGTIVVTTTTRNQYAKTAYTDSGLTNDVTYYYGIFPCSKDGIYTTTYTISVVPAAALKIVTFADGTDEEIAAMLDAHYNGTIDIADYWSVGDMRTIHIDAMKATGVEESHVAQDQQFVIIGIEHDNLKTPINGKTKAAITIQPLRVLSNGITVEKGYMNKTDTTTGGWEGCARRTWCNNVFVNALPTAIQSLVKTVSKLNYKVYNSTNLTTTSDNAFLLSETEIFGSKTNSAGNTEGVQYEYFKTTSNRTKCQGNATSQGSVYAWWERSPRFNYYSKFCVVGSNASPTAGYASASFGLCPAFCL